MYGITMARTHANNADLLNASAQYAVYILQICLVILSGVHEKNLYKVSYLDDGVTMCIHV